MGRRGRRGRFWKKCFPNCSTKPQVEDSLWRAEELRVSGNWRAYFELLRFPAVFTAVADVMMGYLITHGDLRPLPIFMLLVAASSAIYLAGMVLNDAYDAEIDVRERPARPIPSGRVERLTAFRIGVVLLAIGHAAALTIAVVGQDFRPLIIVIILALFVYLYDRFGKRLSVGPIIMGCCRSLNVLLGMSLALQWDSTHLLIAGGIATYIAILTWIARHESTSLQVQNVVRNLLRGIIVIDAAIVLGFCGLLWGSAVLALLVPMLLLERSASTT